VLDVRSRGAGHFEIGQILHLKSEIPKLQIGPRWRVAQAVRFEISDFGSEMQDLSDLEIVPVLRQASHLRMPEKKKEQRL
jgi:hypothetical protein